MSSSQWDVRSLEKPKVWTFTTPSTLTLPWPKQITGYYKHPNKVSIQPPKTSSTASANASPQGIDHNLYVKNGLATLSNYGAGLAVLDVSGVPQDPTGKNIKRIGWFDVHPEDDKVRISSSPDPFFSFGEHVYWLTFLTQAVGGGRVEFVGTWGHFAFPSGYIFVNSIERGGFVVKLNKKWLF
jgi:hypothetical protein